MLGVQNKLQPNKMFFHGVFKDDPKIHFFEEDKLLNLKNVEMIVKMPMPKNPHDIQIFNGLGQFYRCFVKNIAFIMAPITKLM